MSLLKFEEMCRDFLFEHNTKVQFAFISPEFGFKLLEELTNGEGLDETLQLTLLHRDVGQLRKLLTRVNDVRVMIRNAQSHSHLLVAYADVTYEVLWKEFGHDA